MMKFLLIFAGIGLFLWVAAVLFIRVDSARLARWIRNLAGMARFAPMILLILLGRVSSLSLILWLSRLLVRRGQRDEQTAGMNQARACDILGVSPDADEEEIRAAWRELMRHHHPDRGGDAVKAALVNQARDYLLQGRRKAV